MLQLVVDEGLEARAPMELAILQNEIAAGELELSEPSPVLRSAQGKQGTACVC